MSRKTKRGKKQSKKKSRRKRHSYKSGYTRVDACSPKSVSGYQDSATCYPYDALQVIAKKWNKSNPDDLIVPQKSKKELWHELFDKIPQCDNEWCWLDQDFLRELKNNKKLRESFKPPIPKKKWQWLTTDDIENSCRQYEQVVPTFAFLGAYPIDFERIYHYIFGKFKPQKYLDKGYKSIGVVFNEDPHDQPGSHWVGLYIDLVKNIAYFFDSYGDPPHKRVQKWIEKIKPQFNLKYNRTEHQLKNSECGVYTIHFIVRMALGVPFRTIEKDIIRDSQINRKRKMYFNPHHTVEQYW
jgi:hypothetical protein